MIALTGGLALIAALALAGGAAAKHGTSDTEPYIGPAPGLMFADRIGPNVGGAEFSPGDADHVQVTVEDSAGVVPPALVQVVARQGDTGPPLAADAFCLESDRVPIPEEASKVNVFVGPINAFAGAPLFAGELPAPCLGPGTTGTIEAT